MNILVKELEWDSNFFSLKIGSLFLYTYNEADLKDCLEKCKCDGFDLVYVFLDGSALLSPNILQLYRGNLVDTKIIYEYSIKSFIPISESVYNYQSHPSELYDLAMQSGGYSRFKLDPYFTEQDFERLYRTWIDNSLNHTIASAVLVYKEDRKSVGFITLKEVENSVSIGLFATDLLYRGKGIGSSLLSSAKGYAWKLGKAKIEVSTQGDNLVACDFYEKNGFIEKSRSTIYHIWLNK